MRVWRRWPTAADISGRRGTAAAPAEGYEEQPAASVETEAGGLAERLFINRNFVIYTAGALFSATGMWFQQVALGWIAASVGGRQAGLILGLVGFASLFPILALGLVGGLLADLLDRRVLLLVTSFVNAVVLLVLASLVGTGRASVPVILIFALGMGVISALTWPTWQAFINDLVPPRDLARAIALNSARFNLTRVIGPALAGLLLTLVGPAWCFIANAATVVVVMAALLAVTPAPRVRRPREPLRQALFGGLTYVRQAPRARTIMVATAALGLLGLAYNSFLPAFARNVLHAGPAGLGLLMTAVGAGAIFGSIGAGLGSVQRHQRLALSGALALFGLADAAFALSPRLPLALAALVFLGFAMLLYLALANTVLQSEVPPAVLGRLMGVWVIVTSGTTPLGSLAIGALSAVWGVQMSVGLGGLACVACGVLLLRTRYLS